MSEILQVPVKKPTGEPRFAMVPADVLRRSDLSATAKLVFSAMMMESWGSGSVSISHGSLALLCGISRPQAHACVLKLRSVGLLEADGPTVSQVQPYRILHARACLVVQCKPLAPKAAENPKIICPRCHKSCHGLMKIGWCRSCGWDLKVRRIAREEISATA